MMDHERKELLAQKKAQLKVKQQRAKYSNTRTISRKVSNIFSQKYRYADEAEAIKLEAVSGKEGTIQLPRGVLDIHMGNYASGGR